MDIDAFNAHCAGLAHSTHVIQWGGAHVWKIGGKVFAIGGWSQGGPLAVTFKCSPMSFELLKTRPGLRPAPYLASRGMSWIQRFSSESMDDADLRAYIGESWRLAGHSLTRKQRAGLGLD